MRRACATQRYFEVYMFGHARMISAGFCSFYPLPVNMTLKTNSLYIKWSFYIGYFERYTNSKSDYLELLLSVFCEDTVDWAIFARLYFPILFYDNPFVRNYWQGFFRVPMPSRIFAKINSSRIKKKCLTVCTL